MGHLGLQPQSVNSARRLPVAGDAAARRPTRCWPTRSPSKEPARSAIVLESIPEEVAKTATAVLYIPTIGILGAGPYCDGQVLVSHAVGPTPLCSFLREARTPPWRKPVRAATTAYATTSTRDAMYLLVALQDFVEDPQPYRQTAWPLPAQTIADLRARVAARRSRRSCLDRRPPRRAAPGRMCSLIRQRRPSA